MKPILSVIVSTYNTREITRDCIKSLQKSSIISQMEIIVVDDNSTDGTDREISSLKIKNLTYIKNSVNLGFAKTNNKGINIAKGKYVLLLNSDTIVYPDSFAKLVSFAEKTKDAGVIGPKLFNVDGSEQGSCFYFPSITNALREYFGGRRGLFEKYVPFGNNPTTVDAIVGAAFLMTPKALEKIGGLNEKYFFYFEDLDYCRSVWRKGMKVYYYPQAKITHIHGASLKTDPNSWKRLIPGSIVYNGIVKHNILNLVLWIGQKWQKLLQKLS